ncbi:MULTISPECIES: DICT sensory domain-containing protein [Cyanophyceae]|uniref:DICT sensory domain-containing protein n=1 Tax=Cyanophyceae TaxID=3028117 RepID=UPI001683D35C|nr:DICT sensory domain-containing protein [Trichocoleus sp. FACHB-40]MBD2002906.1 GAF domain-containing protein [Trichocoleus sp. FACHB-40]
MDISLFRSVASQYQHIRRVNTVSMMNVISHQIEDQVIQHKLSVDFYAGFQKFSNFPDQLRRYSRLGAICRRVYVFGIADSEPPSIPGVEFIEISPSSVLSREWFLLVNTSSFWTTLVAQEVDGRDITTGGRRFDGLWSFDEQVVDRISLLISQVMESSYQPIRKRNYEQQNIHISDISSRMLSMLEQVVLNNQRRRVHLRTLQQFAETSSSNPDNLLEDTAEILHSIFGATGVVIAGLNPSKEDYSVCAIAGDANGKGWKMPVSEGLIGRAIQQARLIQVTSVRQRHESDPLLPTAKALIAAPIIEGQVYGAIAIGNTESNQWDEDDGQTLMAIARMLAIHLRQIDNSGSDPTEQLSTHELQQAVVEQQEAVVHLLTLQKKLRSLGNLTPIQLEVLRHMNKHFAKLVAQIKIARNLMRK